MTEEREGRTESSALWDAQARLEALRREHQEMRARQGLPTRADEHGRPLSLSPTPTPLAAAPPAGLPAHLGWESAAVTAVWRHTVVERPHTAATPPIGHTMAATIAHPAVVANPPNPPNKPPTPTTITLYPDIALGMLRAELAASGRIWLLLRHLDAQGNGWLSVDEVRKQLTPRHAPLRVCGWRQLRNLLDEGEGVFWQRQNGRIWLRSVVKVAAALDVWRLNGRPVALAVSVLTQRIGQVRAHFYASFHSGRNRETAVSPIARATLQEITHVHPRTQRRYEAQVRVQRQYNYALGPQVQTAAAEQQAWQHGQALFRFTDAAGLHGPAGATYYAWQLPNHYVGPHQPQPRGRQKRHNRELVDLLQQGTTGNGKQTKPHFRQKRFYSQGKAAAKAANRGQSCVYWPGRKGVWFCLEEEKQGRE